jgi:diguanylate cyclase (GGDEF)-like protein
MVVAQAVVARIASLEPGEPGRITVSAGLATFPEDGASASELVECADTRLYRAKSAGGNRVEARSEPLAAAGNGAS